MKKLNKVLLLALATAGLCLIGVGCRSHEEHPSHDHPKAEHPTTEHPHKEHPSSEHPK